MAKIVREKGTLDTRKIVKKKGADEATSYALPTKKTEIVKKLLGYILLLFGEKKIGKTTLLAEGGDDTFFAFFEPGGKALSIFADVFPTWSKFRAAVALIVTEKPRRFNHVVIDTVDLAYKASEKFTLKRLGITHASEEAYGKGWAAQRSDFEEPIMRLVNNGIAVTFVSHADEREITHRDGTKYDKLGPTMPKQPRELVEGLVDIWAYYGYDGKDRVLTILGDDHISAGHRLSNNFKTPAGAPIREIHMGASPAEAYKNFTDAFFNRYTPPKKKEITAEHEAEVSRPPKRTFLKKAAK